LLLAVAVILPTVCLLWFMNQAVTNERLAVRQKLVDVYTERAQNIFLKYSDDYWNAMTRDLTGFVEGYSKRIWLFPENYVSSRRPFAAFVVYDNDGNILYPIPSTGRNEAVLPVEIQRAWNLEYAENNFEEAFRKYDNIAKVSSIPQVVYESKMGIVRCLIKQRKFNEAIEVCYELAYPGKHIINEYAPEQISRARLMLAGLYINANRKDLFKEVRRQFLNSEQTNDPEFTPVQKIPTEARVFILSGLISLTQATGFADRLKPETEKARQIIRSELISIMAADSLANSSSLESWPQMTFRRIPGREQLYGIYYLIGGHRIFCLEKSDTISDFWRTAVDDMDDEMVFCRVLDNTGRIVAGQPKIYIGGQLSVGQQFLSRSLSKFFPDWKVELYFRPGIFAAAARRRQIIYLWTAVLVIGLMTLISLFSTRAILRQVKLNKLKNEFIATVSHELKTPLASIRVLADTLLEGNYKDQKQAKEYLRLICKENRRLTGLIDNFLTFSRMERNKQAFDMEMISPAVIANDAAEAVQTKFKENCKFTVTIEENLPSIIADKDAMVTVLVNLLDNAYKYTNDDKQIELRVYSEDSYICFAVKDNGLGMTRRQIKRIFDRFYQADSSLSRRAEGTGLGLSIVKFIIDAHKGQITVDSKPGKGSKFNIRLPVC